MSSPSDAASPAASVGSLHTGGRRGGTTSDHDADTASSAAARGGSGGGNASGSGSVAKAKDGGPPQGERSKKRRTGTVSRGVANLTPERLAKKRANDREAQRAIRERTKAQIENFERRIRELTSQQPHQDLQAALRAKEAVEAENADIKRRLASVMQLIQPLIADQPQAAIEQGHASTSTSFMPIQRTCASSVHNASTPTSAASPTSADPQSHWHAGLPDASGPNQLLVSKLLSQQRYELRHGLDIGSERLGLDFLLDPSQKITRMQRAVNGAKDSLQFHHTPTKHDWTGAYDTQDGPVGTANGPLPPLTYTAESAVPSYLTDYSAPVKNSPPTCRLDVLLLEFLYERRQRAADGVSIQDIVGPRYPSVSSLLNPVSGVSSHPISKVFTDILSTFPDLSGLPECVAVLYTMFLTIRWQISPTQENYERLPEWLLPRPPQLLTPHPAWIDHLPFPRMREKLVREYNPRAYYFDDFSVPFATTLSLNWPYGDIDTLLQSPDSDELMINPVFERHLRRLENWTLGGAFAKAFPTLVDTYNLKNESTVEEREQRLKTRIGGTDVK